MKVIQVGIGGMGHVWLQTVLASQDVEAVGFVEVNPAIAAGMAEHYGLNPAVIFASLDEALTQIEADAVIDITPPQFHQQVLLTAMDAGLPVLSEKPLAHTLDAAQAIVQKSTETGVLHMVAQDYRYSPPIQTLKHVLQSKLLGEIGAVNVEFYKGPHFGGFRDEMPYPLIIDMSIHHFDLMRYLIGSDPLSVYGRSWNPSWSWFKGDASASVVVDFENGVTASYNGSWCSPGQETSWNGNWRFDCEQGVVMLRDDQVYLQRWIGQEDFNNLYSEIEPVALLELPRVGQAYLLHEFANAVVSGSTPTTTCQDNIRSLGIVFGAVESFKSSQPQKL